MILVLGNHDRPLVRDWLRHNATALPVDGIVPAHASEALERIVETLGPARVDLRYPGVWLGDGTYATHGHYLDKHLLPVSPFGLARKLSRHTGRSQPSPTTSTGPRHRGRVAADVVPAAPLRRADRRPRRRPARRRDGGDPVRHAAAARPSRRRPGRCARAQPADAQVGDPRAAARAAPDGGRRAHGDLRPRPPSRARWAADDPAPWGTNGRPRVLNTGSWIWEPILLYRARPPHPYWPGGAVVIENGEPRAVGLLDGLRPSDLRGGAR